jgi:hypothetical protein
MLSVLGFTPAIGRTWPQAYDFTRQYTVVLSYGFWQRRFGGDPGVIGTKIRLDVADYEVVGVAPPGADFPDRAEAFRAITDYNAEDQRRLSVIARLKPGVAVADAHAAMERFGRELTARYPASNTGVGFELQLIRDATIGAARPYLWRGRLTRHVLTEALLLAVAGGLTGLGLLVVVLRGLTRLIQPQLPVWMPIEIDGQVVWFSLVSTIAAGLVAGALPALLASRTDLAAALTGNGKGAVGSGYRRLQRTFTAAQLALALPLLVGAGLMTKSFWRLQQVDLGFAPSGSSRFVWILPMASTTTSRRRRRSIDGHSRSCGACPV